jgi:cytochrome c-type biogenesis protein CcmE
VEFDMSPKKQRRLAFGIALILAGVCGAALITFALRDNISIFYSPTDLAESPVPPGRSIRIGGLVEEGSVVHEEGLAVRFVVTDGQHELNVRYSGVLPDLFREGQGVIALGEQDSGGIFQAREVLARHDETYMPPEVADALRRAGHFQEGEPSPGSL